MKTSLLSSRVFCNMLFTFLLFGVNLFVAGQCPTINNSNPVICADGAGYSFKDLDTYADYGGNRNNIRWYDSPTGGAAYSRNTLVTEGTYYAGIAAGNCGTRSSLVVDFVVNSPNQLPDKFYCSKEDATFQTYSDDILQPFIPSGGSVEIYTDIELTDPVSLTDIIPSGAPATYFTVLVDSGGCRGQIVSGQIAVFDTLSDPTPPNPQLFCSGSNPTVADLNANTGAFFDWYESTDVNELALLPTEPLVNGRTYYLRTGIFCLSNPIPVEVNINSEESGVSNILNYCVNNLPVSSFNLFNELGGPKDSTGTWTGPVPTTNGHLGTVDISAFLPGTFVFTYTVPANGTCPDLTSTISIEIDEPLTSGTPLSPNPITFCIISLPVAFDLNAQLAGQDPGGQWTAGALSTDSVVTSPIDLSTFALGTYYFTYTQNLPPNICTEESTTIQVDILSDPDAGNAINQNFCENNLAANSPFNLFTALDGTQSNDNGVWRDVNNNTISNVIDITGFTFTDSPYSFSYTVGDLDCSATETILINIDEGPESGTPNQPANFCLGFAPANYNLFDLLIGADEIGTWFIGIDDSGATTSNFIDFSGFAEGTYNYTYEVTPIGSCEDELVTVQVIINALPNAGTPSPAIFCENDLAANSPLDLFGQLTGQDPGGVWTDDNASGALTTSTVNLNLLSIGSYNYTYTITDGSGCENSSTVTVEVQDSPDSGTANPPAEYCEGIGPIDFDLFSLLTGADLIGTWYVGADDLGPTTTSILDLSGFISGTYNYTYGVTPIGTCTDNLVTVQIIISPSPNSGTPSPAIFCENDLAANSPLDLFGQLSGQDPGGVWTDDNASGALTGSAVELAILTNGTYNYTYTVTNSNTCESSSTVVVTIEDAPVSGIPNPPAAFCMSELSAGQTFDLFDLLQGADLTGTWNDDDATGSLSGNTVTLSDLPNGTSNFTYNVDAIGSCDDDDVTVSIIINDIIPPTAVTVQEFCDTATVLELTTNSGTTINWYDASTGGTLLDDTITLIDAQMYYASQIDAVTGCESSLRTAVTVTIYQSPNAGVAIPFAACITDNNIDLFNGLDGSEDAGGTWQNDDGVGTLTGNIFDAVGVPVGSYEFTYIVIASAPCIDAETTIIVNIEEPLSAGIDNVLDICSDNGTTDLFTLLGGADTGGIWSPALTSGTGVFDPLLDVDGVYTYSVTNSCGSDASEVVITVTIAPDAGQDNTTSLCVIDGSTDLFELLGTTAQSGGVWTPALTSGSGVFDPTIDTEGLYTYTVTSTAPCVLEDSAAINVLVNDSPAIIVLNPNPEYCLEDNPTVEELNTSIRPIGQVNWYDDLALTIPLIDSDELVDGEDYYATQVGESGCESSVAVQINVTINDTSTPTIRDSSVDYCINDGPTINDLSLNIAEYDASLNNVVWYDSETGGVAYEATSLISNLTYYATLTDANSGCESSIRLSVSPDVTACEKVKIPDGFSPNGDGVNDTLDIDFLTILYPDFYIEIYNRYGNIVYKGDANTPRFDGTANQSKVLFDGDLPVGVYFYIFNFNDGENAPEQGRIYLSR